MPISATSASPVDNAVDLGLPFRRLRGHTTCALIPTTWHMYMHGMDTSASVTAI